MFFFFGMGTEWNFPKSIRTNRDFRLLREDMHAFFMTPETAGGNLGRKLTYERGLYHEFFSQSFYIKDGCCPLLSTRLSSTSTLAEHEDKDIKVSTKSDKIEEGTSVKHDQKEETELTDLLSPQNTVLHHYRTLPRITIRLWRIPVTRDDEWRDIDSFTVREYVKYTRVSREYVKALRRVRKEEKNARRTKNRLTP